MEELYFDTAATTALLPEVERRLIDAFPRFGNPSSLHRKGLESERLVETARRDVMNALGWKTGRLVFTGSGTEANNLALQGVTRRFRDRGRHIVTTSIEHASVLETCRALETQGYTVTYVRPKNRQGLIEAEDVLEAVQADTILVSVMHINNESGAILPVDTIGAALKKFPKTLFHVDGIQAFGKVPRSGEMTKADLYTISGHKIGAPKGIGALYLKPGLTIEPLIYGGGQEFGVRSGTENLLGITALHEAAMVHTQLAERNWNHVQTLSDLFVSAVREIPNVRVIQNAHQSPYIWAVVVEGVRGEVLVHALEEKGVYVSTGSACSSKSTAQKGNRVLMDFGLTNTESEHAIRVSFSLHHQVDQVQRFIDVMKGQIAWLRSLLS